MDEPKPFGVAVRDLLIERDITTPIGNPDWRALAGMLEGVGYESLTKAVRRERRPAPKIMLAVAKALEVEPTIFLEYQLWQAQRQFDPSEVGEDEAFKNLMDWIKTRR